MHKQYVGSTLNSFGTSVGAWGEVGGQGGWALDQKMGDSPAQSSKCLSSFWPGQQTSADLRAWEMEYSVWLVNLVVTLCPHDSCSQGVNPIHPIRNSLKEVETMS